MDNIACFVLICCFCFGSSLRIKEIYAPDSIELGQDTHEVVLDCDFESDGEEVVVKWFYNGLEELIYQWISSAEHRYASGSLKEYIDLEYKATEDGKTTYRAIRLKDIHPDLSGDYTCKVSSDESEDVQKKHLVIYSPSPSGLELSIQENIVNCTVSGISPVPDIELYIAGENGTAIDVDEFLDVEEDDNGLYNVTTTFYFDTNNLTSITTKFVCDLHIPGTNYSLTKTLELVSDITSVKQSGESAKKEDMNYDYYLNLNNITTTNSSGEIFNLTKDNSAISPLHFSLLLPFFLSVSLFVLSK